MTKRARRNHTSAFKAKVALAAIKGVKWPRAAGPFLAAVKLEGRLLVVLYQAAKGSVCC